MIINNHDRHIINVILIAVGATGRRCWVIFPAQSPLQRSEKDIIIEIPRFDAHLNDMREYFIPKISSGCKVTFVASIISPLCQLSEVGSQERLVFHGTERQITS